MGVPTVLTATPSGVLVMYDLEVRVSTHYTTMVNHFGWENPYFIL